MIYRGKVTAVTSTTATVLVPDLDPVQSFGPLSCVGSVPNVNDIVLVAEVGSSGSSLPDLVVVNSGSGSAASTIAYSPSAPSTTSVGLVWVDSDETV